MESERDAEEEERNDELSVGVESARSETPSVEQQVEKEDEPSDELRLATDRVNTAALESLFTDRTDEDPEESFTARTEAAGDEELAEEHSKQHAEAISVDRADPLLPCDVVAVDGETRDQESNRVESEERIVVNDAIESPGSLQPSRGATPTTSIQSPAPPLSSPTRPSVPARPPRPVALSPPPPQPVALQLITFDVGGKLFRCKASLIQKFPTKRLHHVVSCGCEQIDHATFFIDRNPQHFELILDWYRTGKCPRPLPPHVNEDVLKDDARYFDVFDEMFPPIPVAAPPVPSRTKAFPIDTPATPTALPRLPDRPTRGQVGAPSSTVSSPTPDKKPLVVNGIVRYSKRETRVVPTTEPGGIPNWFCVQAHEHLVVESVKGSGKLLVRVTDVTGMARVFVDQAVLFDSRSWFYLEDDGRAKLQHCVLPGNHVYTFWMEPVTSGAPSPPAAAQTTPAKAKQPAKGKGSSQYPTTTVAPVKPELEVAFRLVSTFSRADEMETDGDLAALLQSKGKGWGNLTAMGEMDTKIDGGAACSCLFLPPRHEPRGPQPLVGDPHKNHDDTSELDERDAIAEQIRVIAAKERGQKPAVVQDPSELKGAASTLKRSGAAIAQQPLGKPPHPAGHGAEKVTVYQPMPPAAATPRSPAKPTPTYSAQQPRHFRQR